MSDLARAAATLTDSGLPDSGMLDYGGWEQVVPEYTVLAVLAAVAVVVVELVWLRTGVFRTAQYWLSLAIIGAFQILVDGWLTKLSAPIVLYDDTETLGLRTPWDIPVEDFLFGFSMVTLAILLWVRQRPGAPVPDRDDSRTAYR